MSSVLSIALAGLYVGVLCCGLVTVRISLRAYRQAGDPHLRYTFLGFTVFLIGAIFRYVVHIVSDSGANPLSLVDPLIFLTGFGLFLVSFKR